MGRGWFICGGSGKDTVPRPPLRESEGDEVSVKPAPAGEDAPADESLKVHVDLNGVQVYFKIKRSTRMHKIYSSLAMSEANKGGAPPGAEGTSPVNAYWWTRKVLAENEVDLDDDHDLADGKSRV